MVLACFTHPASTVSTGHCWVCATRVPSYQLGRSGESRVPVAPMGRKLAGILIITTERSKNRYIYISMLSKLLRNEARAQKPIWYVG